MSWIRWPAKGGSSQTAGSGREAALRLAEGTTYDSQPLVYCPANDDAVVRAWD